MRRRTPYRPTGFLRTCVHAHTHLRLEYRIALAGCRAMASEYAATAAAKSPALNKSLPSLQNELSSQRSSANSLLRSEEANVRRAGAACHQRRGRTPSWPLRARRWRLPCSQKCTGGLHIAQGTSGRVTPTFVRCLWWTWNPCCDGVPAGACAPRYRDACVTTARAGARGCGR
jgi:hypothetical protein